jgi:hypothetical protein
MRNSNKYVLRGLQNEFNVEIQDNCEMRNSNKYVLRGLQNEIIVEVQDNNMFYVDFRMCLMWKYKIIVR